MRRRGYKLVEAKSELPVLIGTTFWLRQHRERCSLCDGYPPTLEDPDGAVVLDHDDGVDVVRPQLIGCKWIKESDHANN
jgi:hypothetical protein